jgi:hypothetical protein
MKSYKQILEDSYASDYKVKKFLGPDGKWQERKLRPHRVDFKASKMRGEPAQNDDRGDVGMKEEKTTGATKLVHTRTGANGAKYHIMQDSPTDYSIHREHKGKTTHIDTYGSLHRAKSVLDNEVKEETNMTIDEQINEVLSKDATAGDWIHDFVHSDNPKFEGKSKDKRKQMALAAYYAKQQNEEVKDEYARKVDKHLKNKYAPVAPVPDKKFIKGTPENLALKASRKPINGHPTNVKEGTMKSFKEMVQSLDEKSEQAKQNKTMKNMMDASRGARYKLNNPVPPADPEHKTAQAHNKAIGRALRNEAKDESEYGYEGDMAMTQLKTMCRHAEEFMGMLKPDTDLPEWVQSKITLATDYIQTAHDYMSSEMNEEVEKIDEVDYFGHDSIRQQSGYRGPGQSVLQTGADAITHGAKAVHKAIKNSGVGKSAIGGAKAIKHAVKKVFTKEELEQMQMEELKGSQHKLDKNKNGKVDAHDFKILRGEQEVNKEEVETRTVSFRDFISQLNEYTPGPGGVTRVQGRSYGAQYRDPEGEDDADDKKKQVAKSEPAVKRGRGRPAGSKSGANQKVTTGRKGSGVDYTGYKLHLPNSNR